jgi:hypothetical protein
MKTAALACWCYERLVHCDVITQACGQTVTFDSPPPTPHNTDRVLYTGAVAICDNRRHNTPVLSVDGYQISATTGSTHRLTCHEQTRGIEARIISANK